MHRLVGAMQQGRDWRTESGALEQGKGRGGEDVSGVRWDVQGEEVAVSGFCCSHNTYLLCSGLHCNVTGFSVPCGGKLLYLQGLSCLQSSFLPSFSCRTLKEEGMSTKAIGIAKNFSQKNQGGSTVKKKIK